jgi:hypothetical protein
MQRAVIGAVVSGCGPRMDPGWAGFRGSDPAIVLHRVSDVLAGGTSVLAPAEVLTAVCEEVAPHLALATMVFFKRVAGQSRSLVWAAPGVATSRRLAACEQAWTSAAELVERGTPLAGPGGGDGGHAKTPRGEEVATATFEDVKLGLSALLYVESGRILDGHDRWLLTEILRHMLCSPRGDVR